MPNPRNFNAILNALDYPGFKQELASSACPRCPLSSSRTHIVVDRGNPDAQVLFIGEAPGQMEDLEGRAFVGRSGRLLDTLLKQLDFDTDRDALIANVVKCRPPKNRAPLPPEIEACRPYLQKQIQLMNPRVIALLGATAVKHILPGMKAGMADRVGKNFEDPAFPGKQILVLYHPAYILRDPRKRALMLVHLKRLVELGKRC